MTVCHKKFASNKIDWLKIAGRNKLTSVFRGDAGVNFSIERRSRVHHCYKVIEEIIS